MKLANQLIHGDSLEVMGAMPQGRYNLVIADPPYGTTDFYWDKKVSLERFWNLANRVTKDNGIFVLFGAQPFTTELITSNRKQFRYELIWQKNCPVGYLDANNRPLRNHENILIFSKKGRGSTYNPQKTPGEPYSTKKRKDAKNTHYGNVNRVPTANPTGDRHPKSVLAYNNRHPSHWHPTQKPLDLLEWLVRSYSNPGDWVLDPFAGSASTAFAARNNGRKFTCIEKHLEYHTQAFNLLFPNVGKLAA